MSLQNNNLDIGPNSGEDKLRRLFYYESILASGAVVPELDNLVNEDVEKIYWRLVNEGIIKLNITEANLPTRLSEAALSATYARVVAPTATTNAAVLAAITAAGPGGTVYLGPGDWPLSSTWTFDEVSLLGAGMKTRVITTALGAGVPAIIATDSTGSIPDTVFANFDLIGPGNPTLGVKNANVDGISINGKAMPVFRDIRVRGFDTGVVLNNTSGHIYFEHVNITNNYYGVYCKLNSYDYMFSQSKIDGNTFANFATSADQGFAGMVIRDSHCGFAPYGIYQEPTPINQGKPKVFLQEVILSHVRFEQIGNAAIFTEAQQDATNASITSDLRIEHPGFSWSPAAGTAGSYQISGRTRDYAIVLSQTDRVIEIIQGAHPFTAGTVNTILVKLAGHVAILFRGAATSAGAVTTTSGTPNVYAYAAPVVAGGSPSFDRVTVAGDGTNSLVDLTTSTNRYVQFNGSNARMGGDAANNLFHDGASFKVRNSTAGFATLLDISAAGTGFNGAAAAKPSLTYSRTGESAAEAALRGALVTLGLVTDSTVA